MVVIWYGIVPITGALFSRYKWKRFREKFYNLYQAQSLDYRQYRNPENDGKIFKFNGGIESLTDGKILWVKDDNCTIPVSLEKTQCWLLPMHEGTTLPEPPQLIKWNRVSTLTEGVKVFIGGEIKAEDNRLNFISSKENPLIVIFYNCPENELLELLILASRTRNDYWNTFTPVSLLIGAFSLIYIAASLLPRPAFRHHVIAAMVAVFTPILPVIPPGLLFSAAHRRLTWYARKLRAYRDLALFGNHLGYPVKTTSIKAYVLEVAAWIILTAGVIVNIFFILLIISLLG
ncbi:MAG: hypothetical protein LBU88_00045 [Treponema sp.]|jgi:hypothetical protein|nr:hypothetical protein [Treponema sp.]